MRKTAPDGLDRAMLMANCDTLPVLPDPVLPTKPICFPVDMASAPEPPAKPPRKPATSPLPFAAISGAVSTFPVSWTTPEERKAALNRWVVRIAKEVGRAYETKSERDAAVEFVRAHRLSIAHAFERKLVRKDVVEALLRLYVESKRNSS